MQIYNITNMITISYVQDGVNFAEVEQWSRKNEDIKKYVFAKQIQKNKSI